MINKQSSRYQVQGIANKFLVYDNGKAVASFSRQMDAMHWIALEGEREKVGKYLKQFMKDIEQGKVKSQDIPF